MTKKIPVQLWLILAIPIILIVIICISNKNSLSKSFSPQSAGIFQYSQQIDTSIKKINLGKYRYQNKNPLYKTSFQTDPTKSTAINFTNKYTELSFFTNPTQTFAKANSSYSPQVKNNQIIYSSIFPNTDLVYTVNPNQLLEEFVVYDKNTALNMTKISQTLDRSKIDSYKEINGAIELYKNEKLVATIPRPVIYEKDDKSIRSYGLSYQVTPTNNDYLTITKVIDQEGLEWLSDPKRNYPIVIDLVIDNADTAASWVSSDTTHTTVSQETSIKQEGTGSVKVTTSDQTTTTLDLMEYSTDSSAQSNYVKSDPTIATGGTVSTITDYTVHTFLSSSTFIANSSIANADVLVVAGGGGGAADRGGGGGAGGLIYQTNFAISSGSHSVTVGSGGAGTEGLYVVGGSGSNSVFSTLTAIGGGGGGTGGGYTGVSGGSGGGGGNSSSVNPCAGGSGTSGQGYAGGQGVYQSPEYGTGGGGGAGEVGQNGTSTYGGDGGDGRQISINGTSTYYAGGGGGASYNNLDNGTGGLGGGGNGGYASGSEPGDGTPNTGGGGGGRARAGNTGGDGGSGIVIIRYPTPLQSYSSTTHSQGSYSLKGIAQSGTSLNQTLTRTISSPINLTNMDYIKLDLRSSRTGSNIKIGIHDSGGTTSEITPNITSADTFQTVTWDISGISNANKDNIDKIVITIVNANAINTFYLDNLYATGGSLNDTVTLTVSPTDLSNEDSITFWVRSNTTGQFSRFQFGESTSSEQTYDITINSANTWERKVFDISDIGSTSRNGVTKYAFKITNQSGAPLLYFDDTQTGDAPNTPSLDSPSNGATNQSLTPSLLTTTTDAAVSYLRYKIELCENPAMTDNCQTFDQTLSQTGWSGQNTQSNTAYTSGTQATYTIQSNLDINTTYYWRSYAIDPGGLNLWSDTQATPFSFKTITSLSPDPPINCIIKESVDDSQLRVFWTDIVSNEDGYTIQRKVNGGTWTTLQNLGAGTTTYTDSDISPGNTYQYKIASYYTGPIYSEWCTTSLLTLGVGNFNFEGLNFEGINLN